MTLGEFKVQLETFIKELPTGSVSELEFRLGFFPQGPSGKFVTSLSVETFHQIGDSFKANGTREPETQSILTIIPDMPSTEKYRVRITETSNNIQQIQRFCVTDLVDSKDSRVVVLQKTQRKTHNMPDYGFRISAADETVVDETEVLDSIQSVLREGRLKPSVRRKHHYRFMKRYHFRLDDDLSLDMSIVKSADGGNFRNSRVLDQPEHYEVELELSNVVVGDTEEERTAAAEKLYQKVSGYLQTLVSLYMGGISIASNPTRDTALRHYSELIGDSDKYKPAFAGPNIVALEHEDLLEVDGVRNISVDSIVTDKADGDRNLLYSDPSGNLYLVDRKMGLPKPVGAKLQANTLLDGELIVKGDTHYFLVFDALFIDGVDLRALDFYNIAEIVVAPNHTTLKADVDAPTSRYGKLLKLVGKSLDFRTAGQKFVIIPKDFHPLGQLRTVQSILSVGDKLTKNYPLLGIQYELDGLVIQHPTGEKSRYPKINNITHTSSTVWENVLKWKPASLITVDFKVLYGATKKVIKGSRTPFAKANPDGNFLEIALKYQAGKNEDPFVVAGHDVWYFNVDAEGNPRTRIDNRIIKDGDIVECGWDAENDHWFPLRIRYDKTHPNGTRTVFSNWNLLQLPIRYQDLGDLKAFDGYWASSAHGIIDDMKRAHNKLKTVMLTGYFGKMPESTTNAGPGPKLLLDLGVGRANDVHKWHHIGFTDVVGVDVDQNALQQGLGRVSAYPDLKVTLINGDFTKPLETVTRPEFARRRFGLVTCFFSAHYALGTETSFRNLLYNVSKKLDMGGYLIGTTFNRDSLLQLLDKKPIAMGSSKILTDSATDVFHTVEMVGEKKYDVLSAKKNVGTRDAKLMWEIRTAADQEQDTPFGYTADVFVQSIGKTHREYLMSFDDDGAPMKTVLKLAKEYGLDLEETRPFGDLIKDKLSVGEQTFSNLNTVFVFKKTKEMNYDELVKKTAVAVSSETSRRTTIARSSGAATRGRGGRVSVRGRGASSVVVTTSSAAAAVDSTNVSASVPAAAAVAAPRGRIVIRGRGAGAGTGTSRGGK